MESIKWVKSPDCRSCVFELENVPRRKLMIIIESRKHLSKCNRCERLRLLEAKINGK